MKKLFLILVIIFIMLALLTACASEATIASKNTSMAADQFQIERRIVFYNGITGDYILSIEGLCSLGNYDGTGELSVTCKTGPRKYKKHFLGLSDNVTYFLPHPMQSCSALTIQIRITFDSCDLAKQYLVLSYAKQALTRFAEHWLPFTIGRSP